MHPVEIDYEALKQNLVIMCINPSPQSPLNVFRYCPKCGNRGFMPDSAKSLKCKSCGFRYFINMSASVVAIIRNKNENEKVLFTIRKNDPAAGMLDLPGGFVDPGETAENALVREISEELNLVIKKMGFIGTFTNKYLYDGIEYETLDLVYNCLEVSFDNLTAGDDVAGYVFRNPCTVKKEEIGLDSIRNIVDYISQH